MSKEHVFARLEIDSPSVCAKLVELTYKSFINEEIDNNVQLERCIELIESGLERTRRFFRYAVLQINIQQAGNSSILTRRCPVAVVCICHKKLIEAQCNGRSVMRDIITMTVMM